MQISIVRYGSPSSAIIPSARPSSSSSSAGLCSGVAMARISTLSNSWARSMPAGVLAGRAGLPPEARGVGHQPLGQLGLVEDLVAVDRRQRHLGGGDRPQPVALDGVGVVGELRQVARRRQRRRGDQRRRADLLERVGVAVEGELAQRPAHRRPEPASHREHRAADLRRPLVVEDAERGARLPVRHALVLGELVGQSERPWTIGLSASDVAVGGVGMRQVGERQQQVAQLGGRRASCSAASSLLLVAERPALRRQLVGRGRVARPAPFADLLGELVDPGPHGVTLAGDVAQPGVELGRGVELVEQLRAAAGEPAPRARRRGRCAAGGRRSQGRDATGVGSTLVGWGGLWRTRARRRRTSACRR